MKYILLTFLSCIIICCNNHQISPNPKIHIYDQSIETIINVSSEIEVLADSIALPEGPVWDDHSKSLLFVDIINNKVLKWNEQNGVVDYIMPSGNTGYAPNLGEGILGANGLSLNNEGDLILCQHGDRRIAITKNVNSNKPVFSTLIDNYQGKRLNSPNDITISRNGSIYFTDPPFAFFDLTSYSFVETEMRELDFNGVFKFNPESNELDLISRNIEVPNGLALSPDEKFLYVNKMGNPFSLAPPKIIKIDLNNMKSETFFDGSELLENLEGNYDGMKMHSSGNLFTSGPGGLLVISPKGKLLARIDFGHITNCAFDKNEEYLYATGFVSNPKLFRIKLSEKK
ncbi:MAG: gluconolactonase [Flavobacteriaceae bacterium]|nr:gluconolactonase [Flavobacteriaceae bacterium]